MLFIRLLIAFTLTGFGLSQAEKAAENRLDYSKESLQNLLQAHFAIYQQDHDQALKLFLTEAKKHSHQALLEESVHLALSKQNKMALLEATTKWISLTPDNRRALFFHAIASAYNGKLSNSIKLMREAEINESNTDYTWLVSLSSKISDKERQESIKHLRFAEDDQCENFDAILALSLLLAKTQNPKKIPALVTRALQLGQHNPTTFSVISSIYQSIYMEEKAIDALQQGVLLHPRQQHLRFRLARLLQNQAPQSALMHYEFLHFRSPHNANIILAIANTHKQLGQSKESLLWFEKLSETQYKNEAFFHMASIAQEQSQDKKALGYLENIDADEQTDQVKAKIIKLLIKLGQTKEAKKILKHLLKEKKEQNATELIVYQMLWIDLLEKYNQPTKAFKQINQWLQAEPDEPLLLLRSALIASTFMPPEDFKTYIHSTLSKTQFKTSLLERLGEFLAKQSKKDRELREKLQNTLAFAPENPILMDSYGWLLYRMGRAKDAAFWVSKAQNQSPSAKSAAHLGEILWSLGDKEKAKEVLIKAHEKTPNDQELTQTLHRLNLSYLEKP